MSIRIDIVQLDFQHSKRVVWFTEDGRAGEGHRLELPWRAEDDLRAELVGEAALALAPGTAEATKAQLAKEIDDLRRERATLEQQRDELKAANRAVAQELVAKALDAEVVP